MSVRVEQIYSDCFVNETVSSLAAERECHSDDEERDDGNGYDVHKKPGRDGAVDALFDLLTTRRNDAMARRRKKGSW